MIHNHTGKLFLNQLICLLGIVFIVLSCRNPARANEATGKIVLYSGEVYLLDQNNQRTSIHINQEFSLAAYPKTEIGSHASLFIQIDDAIFNIQTPGIHRLIGVDNRSGISLSNALQFLRALVQPRQYTTDAKVRGVAEPDARSDRQYFERQWQLVVEAADAGKPTVPDEDMLATAAWYEQHSNPTRSAYILEQLATRSDSKNPLYNTLRNDALKTVSLSDIMQEVDDSKKAMLQQTDKVRYKALLIGVSHYQNPYWQNLENPIRDVRAIQKMLIDKYRFSPENITVLTDPSFVEIISGFQQVRDEVDENTELLIYYAGHGYYPPAEDEGYWIPANGETPETQRFFIPTSIILSKLKAIRSRHTLLIADSCFSGSLIRKSRSAAANSRFYRELSRKKSRQIITSGGLEPVLDQGENRHSAFAAEFLNILEASRTEPLSASELAFLLRKDLKNSGISQTPEYGRLYMADDENGEFFFVQKDQDLSRIPSETVIATTSDSDSGKVYRGSFGHITNDPNASFQFMSDQYWISLGVFYYLANVEYNYPYVSNSDEEELYKITSHLVGRGMQLVLRKAVKQQGYGIRVNSGQFVSVQNCTENSNVPSNLGIQSCDESAQDKLDLSTTLNGSFYHIGLFADVSLINWHLFSLQLGGAVQMEHMEFENYLGDSHLNSDTLAACGNIGFSLRNNNWSVRTVVDVCVNTIEYGGSLYRVDNEYGRDARVTSGVLAGLKIGYAY